MKASAPALPNVLLCAAFISVVVLVYWPTSSALWDYWTASYSAGSHGPLIALISAWLLYRNRRALNESPVKPVWWLAIPLILMSLAWLVFWRAHIPALHIILFPALMGFGIAAALGWKAARWVAFPLGFLYFAVPSWDVLTGPLQMLTEVATGTFAPLIGIPSHVEGDLLQIPGVGTFEIGRGCSGVNFFAIGLAVAALLGELEGASVLRRLNLLCIMGVAAIVSNWVRVLVIVEAGYKTNMRHYLVARSHYMFGWVLFSIVMFGFVWLCSRPSREPAVAAATQGRAGGLMELRACASVVLCLIAVPLSAYGLGAAAEAAATPFAFQAPGGAGGWRGPLADEQRFIYEAPSGDHVELTALAASVHDPSQELTTVLNSLAGASDSPSTRSREISVEGLPYVETVIADSKGERILLWSAFDVGGRRFVTPLLSRLWSGFASLGGQAHPVLLAFWTPCAASCEASHRTLTDFAKTLGPGLSQSLRVSESLRRVSQSPSNQRAL